MMKKFDKEKREWLDITNFDIWQVLRLVSSGRNHIRGIGEKFKGSYTTLEITVNRLVGWGFLRSRWEGNRRVLSLSERGNRLLGLLDDIGELVKESRDEKG